MTALIEPVIGTDDDLERERLKSFDHVVTTTKSIRKRLDTERPVPREVIEECLDLALCAPSASNWQNWRWLVVTDPDKRAALAYYYRLAFEIRTRTGPGRRRTRFRDTRASDRLQDSSTWLAENLERVPVLVVPCLMGKAPDPRDMLDMEAAWGIDHDSEVAAPRPEIAANAMFYGSIYPAVWQFALALRSRGLGSCITTMHLAFHQHVADELGIPRNVTQTCLMPVAYTKGLSFTRPARQPLADVAVWDDWMEPRGNAAELRAAAEAGMSVASGS